jgi:arylsulfatase A-like enzyme
MRPNLLLFMTDQQRADSLGAFGNPAAHTPNLDALAARGVRFTNAFGQHSACSQSRISMMTGWYPHVAGHRTLDHLLQPWEPNVLRTLKGAGYFVAWAGIRGDTFAPGVTADSTDVFGFTVSPDLAAVGAAHAERYPEGHRLRHSFLVGRLDGEDLVTMDEAAVRTAIDLLGQGLPEPWVLVVTLLAPHPPFAVEDPWFSVVDRALVPSPLPPGSGKPGFMVELRRRAGLDRLEPDDWAEIAATYLGMVARVDEQFGRSLVPVLADPSVPHRDRAFSEGGFRIDEAAQNEIADHHPYLLKASLQQERPDLVGRAACVRSQEWTFVHRLHEPDELYDRRADPHESTNLAADPAHREVVRSLRDELLDWLTATSDVIAPTRDPRMDESLVEHLLGSTRIDPLSDR